MSGPADMSLRAYQEAALRVFFDPSPSEDDLTALGSPERFRIYRNMVRHRLDKVVRAALPRTLRALGDDATAALLTEFFAEAPPRTRWFREVPEHFGAFALARFSDDLPAHVPELCRFELARWTVQHLESEPAAPVVPLSFELPPATTPALRRLRVQHRVDRRGDTPTPEPANLAVYRRLDDRPSTWVLNDIAAALLDAFVDGEGTLAERVQAVTKARDVAIDETFLERLSALLADFVERGVLLGSYAAAPAS
ncbi:MAG: DNA-binding domain-containing protein [Polyangiales bacterium]|nr:putative DNA-binding domain-containing protein [Myxococcales bacterium]MCB9659851.1 putative DNA-binding domain-containing protein [Sandaracinaceae bacterium]